MAIRKMREENGHPFKTYERGFPVGRLEVHSVFRTARLCLVSHFSACTIMLGAYRPWAVH